MANTTMANTTMANASNNANNQQDGKVNFYFKLILIVPDNLKKYTISKMKFHKMSISMLAIL